MKRRALSGFNTLEKKFLFPFRDDKPPHLTSFTDISKQQNKLNILCDDNLTITNNPILSLLVCLFSEKLGIFWTVPLLGHRFPIPVGGWDCNRNPHSKLSYVSKLDYICAQILSFVVHLLTL